MGAWSLLPGKSGSVSTNSTRGTYSQRSYGTPEVSSSEQRRREVSYGALSRIKRDSKRLNTPQRRYYARNRRLVSNPEPVDNESSALLTEAVILLGVVASLFVCTRCLRNRNANKRHDSVEN